LQGTRQIFENWPDSKDFIGGLRNVFSKMFMQVLISKVCGAMSGNWVGGDADGEHHSDSLTHQEKGFLPRAS